MPKLLLICLFLLSCITIYAQDNQAISIGIIDFFQPSKQEVARKAASQSALITLLGGSVDYEGFMGEVRQFKNFATEVFLRDNRFIVVERDMLNIIEDERELQKAEEFIDGFTVEQGKAIGAQYLLLGDFTLKGYILSLSLYSVSDQRVVEKETFPLVSSQLADLFSSSEKVVQKGTRRLIQKAFPFNLKVLRTLKGGDKAKEVLVGGGKKVGLKKNDKLLVRETVLEEIDGEKLPRLITKAVLSVKEVEGDHFSRCKVVSGGSYISQKLSEEQGLFCVLREE